MNKKTHTVEGQPTKKREQITQKHGMGVRTHPSNEPKNKRRNSEQRNARTNERTKHSASHHHPQNNNTHQPKRDGRTDERTNGRTNERNIANSLAALANKGEVPGDRRGDGVDVSFVAGVHRECLGQGLCSLGVEVVHDVPKRACTHTRTQNHTKWL